MAATSEYLPIISKLLQKTRERKIDWKGTYESTTFICALEGEYSFEIEQAPFRSGGVLRSYMRLTMKDREEGAVFVVSAYPPDDETSVENDELFRTLDDLFEQARRVALQVDKKVSDVTSILDKI